jgi:chloramphenicol-sensitive protein RarD
VACGARMAGDDAMSAGGRVLKQDEQRSGIGWALAAFGLWGVGPIYFKAVAHVPPFQLLAHRVVWCVTLTAVLITLGRDWRQLREGLRDRRTTGTLALSAALVAINWFTYIFAVTTDHIVEASLGYFINPLVNVLLGMLFLHERLTRLQLLAVLLALAGTLNLTLSVGAPPWIALTLAVCFGFYGLLRKTVRIEAVNGLFVETAMLAPVASGYLLWLGWRGEGAFGAIDLRTDALLLFAGVITALPLVWFTRAARRLRYITIGLLQYIAPTLQLLIGVLVYGEPFTRAHWVTFGLIWAALAIFTWDAVSRRPGAQCRASGMRTAG